MPLRIQAIFNDSAYRTVRELKFFSQTKITLVRYDKNLRIDKFLHYHFNVFIILLLKSNTLLIYFVQCFRFFCVLCVFS